MLIAHAPAGYLLSTVLSRTLFKKTEVSDTTGTFHKTFIGAGILGGIFPDFDFIYHVFVDSSRTPHHSYFTHMPIFWAGTWLLLFAIGKLRRNGQFVAIATSFCAAAMLHVFLDTLTGEIYWLYPFSHKGYNFFTIADVHVWWVENFTHHWTFSLEILIVAVAALVFLRVPQTVAEILALWRNPGPRSLMIRLGACMAAFAVVVLVGSLQFNVKSHAIEMVIKIKHHVARMI
jgi:inner membrane protein